MLTVITEIFTIVVLALTLGYLLWKGRPEQFHHQPGWRFLAVGFIFILVGGVVGLSHNFPITRKFVIIDGAVNGAVLSQMLGYLIGSLLIFMGLRQWFPVVAIVESFGQSSKKFDKNQDQTNHERIIELERLTGQLQNELEACRYEKETLGKSERQFRTIVEAAPVPIIISRISDGAILYVNKSVGPALGLTDSEIMERNILEFYHDPADRSVLLDTIKKKSYVHNYELRARRADGTPFWVTASAQIMMFDGEPALLGGFYDITERKQANFALRESENRYKRLVESVTDYIYSVKVEHGKPVATTHGPGCVAVTGYAPQEYQADPELWYQMVYEEDRGAVIDQAKKVVAGEDVLPLEHRIVHKNGSTRWVRNTYVPRLDGHGCLTGYDGLIKDVTERKEAETALRESEAKFRTLAETAAAAIFIYQDTQLQYVNPAAESITGYTRSELIGMNFWDVVHPVSQVQLPEWGPDHQQRQDVPSRHELRILTKQGEERWIDFTAGLIDFSGRPAILGTAFDITERKRAGVEREQLLKTEREQRLLAETLGEVFLALASLTRREAVLDEILSQVQRLAPNCATNITLLEDNMLRVVRWQGYQAFDEQEPIANLVQSPTDFPLDSEVIQSRQPFVIPDTTQNPDWVALEKLAWIRSSISVPICLHSRVLGLLRLDSDVPGRFSDSDVERLLPLANAAAIALENARLYEQVRQELTERELAQKQASELNSKLLTLQYAGATIAANLDLQYILDTVTREMVDLVEVEVCIIFEMAETAKNISLIAEYGVIDLWETELPDPVHHFVDLPLTKEVLSDRRARQVAIDQPDIDPLELTYLQATNVTTILLMPMEFQDRVVGLVALMDSKTERVFSPDEIALAQLLANQAASAIENARLFDHAQMELAERMQAERDLRQVAAKQQAILNAIPDSMFYLSRDGKLLDYKMVDDSDLPLGPGEPLIGTSLTGFIATDLNDLFKHYIVRTLDTGAMQAFEYRLSVPDGWQDFEARLVTSDPNEVLAIVRDITERKRAEEALAKERNVLRTLIDHLPDYIFVNDVEGRFVVNNMAHVQFLGVEKPEEIVGKTIFEFLPQKEAARHARSGHMVIQTGRPIFNEESSFVDKLGHKEWRLTTQVPLSDRDGNVTGLVSISRDISQRRQTERALRKSEANLRAIFDNSRQAFVLIDRDCKVQSFNRAAYEGAGLKGGPRIKEGDPFHKFLSDTAIDEFNGIFDEVLDGKSVRTEKRINVEETERWFEFNYNPVLAEDGKVIGVCFSTVDIDARKRAAEALAASEARLWAEMRSMLAVTRALVSEIKINGLLEFIMSQAKDLLAAEETAVLLLSDDGQHLEAATPTESSLGIRHGSQLPVQGSLAGLALASQQVQISTHVRDQKLIEPILTFLELAEVNALLCAPLIFQRKNLGILLAWNTSDRAFTAPNSLLMEVFADQAALALYNAKLHAQNRLLAIEQERQRLARGLHDSVTQSLYSIGLAAQASLRLLDPTAETALQEPIEHIHVLSQTALAEMREQLYHLHPTGLDKEDLIEVLSDYFNNFGRLYALEIEFEAKLELPLSTSQRDALYYIAREALWNVVKHAKANRVDISLSRARNNIVLTVEDDGIGFDLSAVAGRETMGLRTMRERAKLVTGTIEIRSSPDRGARVIAQIPVDS